MIFNTKFGVASMSLWCECLDCGGSGDAFICENGLLRAQIMAAKSQQSVFSIMGASGLFPVFALTGMILFLAGGAATTAVSNTPAEAEVRIRMSDGF